MGLDMYLTGRKFFWRSFPDKAGDRFEDDKRVKSLDVELGYWRKHPNLHGFIVREFAEGKDDCHEIELSLDNLRAICAAVKRQSWPKTTRFFFGESDGSADEMANDLSILGKAIDWLQAGDDDPVTLEPIGAGLGVIITAKPEAKNATKQSVTRSVHYLASW